MACSHRLVIVIIIFDVLDENKSKLSLWNKEDKHICRFDDLSYYHRWEHSSTIFW